MRPGGPSCLLARHVVQIMPNTRTALHPVGGTGDADHPARYAPPPIATARSRGRRLSIGNISAQATGSVRPSASMISGAAATTFGEPTTEATDLKTSSTSSAVAPPSSATGNLRRVAGWRGIERDQRRDPDEPQVRRSRPPISRLPRHGSRRPSRASRHCRRRQRRDGRGTPTNLLRSPLLSVSPAPAGRAPTPTVTTTTAPGLIRSG